MNILQIPSYRLHNKTIVEKCVRCKNRVDYDKCINVCANKISKKHLSMLLTYVNEFRLADRKT